MAVIRPRCPADLPACVAALAEVHDADGYPARWPADPAGWLDVDNTLSAYVACERQDVVGHLALVTATRGPGSLPAPVAAIGVAPQHLAMVARLFVTPAARGRGVASALLATAREEASSRGLAPMLDVVESGRTAIRLYERLGWQQLGSEPAGWTLPDGQRPIVHYYLAPPA